MPQTVDFFFNIVVICLSAVLLSLYCGVVLLPPWDDGTGLANLEQLQQQQDDFIPRHVDAWLEKLQFRLSSSSSSSSSTATRVATLFDPEMELGRAELITVHFCDKFCPCSAASAATTSFLFEGDADSGKSCRDLTTADQVKQRFLAKARKEAIALETKALARLIVRLRHYYDANAGIDALATAIVNDGTWTLEKASTRSRHASWLTQPRLPPPSPPGAKTSLVFMSAERSDAWVNELAMDPQANALKHAPFVFPVVLTMLACFVRILKGFFKREAAAAAAV